jgi:competence protein ComFB
MIIHNYVEEEVLSKVGEIFEAEDKLEKKRFCTCEYCRADVACFVLNRVPPVYQTSGRGLAHREMDYKEKLQKDADLVALVYRGIERITETRRPHGFTESEPHEAEQVPEGFFFNLPQIVGRLFHSTRFEPMVGLEVKLLSQSGKSALMIDSRWTNPCVIPSSVPGVFSFWPVPKRAKGAGEKMVEEMKIAVDAEGFEPLRHYFSVEVVSEEGYLRFGAGNRVCTLPDLFLVPTSGGELPVR